MRSKDMAKLAGVSVRTLRHYHKLGLMPEPSRSPNGYRDYTPADLVRLLRIKHLASLGFSLSQISTMLEDLDGANTESRPGAAVLDALDTLDRELTAKIESLQEQRRVVAQLKTDGLNPDMPLRFARIWQKLDSQRNLDDLDTETRIALLLVGHLYNDSELDELERVVCALVEDDIAQNAEAVHELHAGLAPDASSDDIERVVAESLVLLTPLIEIFDADNWQGGEKDRDRVLKSVASAGLNPVQVKAVERIEEEIEAQLAKRAANE